MWVGIGNLNFITRHGLRPIFFFDKQDENYLSKTYLILKIGDDRPLQTIKVVPNSNSPPFQ